MASIRSGIGENMEYRYLYKAKTTPKEKGEFNNVWVTGNLIVSNGKYYIHPVGNVVNVKNETGRIIVMHEVIPDTICQCTGLKDKNGKLIWENDIIECKDGKHNFQTQIEWDAYCAGFIFQDTQTSAVSLDTITANGLYSESKVIGNIFDNKELVESEEKQ